jgi:hypothetical protein
MYNIFAAMTIERKNKLKLHWQETIKMLVLKRTSGAG